VTRQRLNDRKFDPEQGQWHSVDQQTIQELSSTGRHQECLQACQQLFQSEPENSLPWKYAGKSLLALGEFEKAQQCLAKAHQLDTSDPETIKDIGNTFLSLGNKDTAAQWYEKSLGVNHNYAPALNNLANLKRQGGNNQKAVDLFKQAIQADPQLIQAYAGAAASYLALGDLDQAELFAKQAIELNAGAPGMNEILGIIFQNKKKFRQAVESYHKELGINPKSNTSLLNLGLLLLQQGEAAAAIEPLARATAINPSEQCSLLLAQAYQNIGKLKEAISEYKKIDITQSQNKMIPFNLGLCLLKTGSNIDAINAFKIAIKLDESFLPAWGNIGTALMNEGRHREALRVTQKVIALDPDNSAAHMDLGVIHKNFGNLNEALNSTLKSLELKPNNPIAHMNLGSIYKELGDLDKALNSTLKSLELKPDNPTTHMNLGTIYKELGNLDKALNSTLKSLELKPDNPTTHMNLGGIYIELSCTDQALASTIQSLEIKPDNPDAHENLSIIYLSLEKLDEALNSIMKSLEIKPNNASSLYHLSYIRLHLSDLCEAEESIKKAINIDQDKAKYHLLHGLILYAKGDIGGAKISYRRALSAGASNDKNDFHIFLLKSFLNTTKDKAPPNRDFKRDDFPIILYRPIEAGLTKKLSKLDAIDLNKVQDPTFGKARGSHYQFFKNEGKDFKYLEEDLISRISMAFASEIHIVDSFYTILSGNSIVKRHNHMSLLDKEKNLNIGIKKYSLVYYLKTGNQNCGDPGYLQLFNPDRQILPTEGMVIIFPADHEHSVKYSGNTERIIIGINFYTN